ncbi:MAG: 2-oxoacid:acceptor oxidoreductase subunit alpha [Candidatus Eisenbacteria bacterium]|nr:2-oxoacid:acceptor oxidoreductase subunit alpha [Candidatus Eisenbacteria bacterium]MCC7142297.1 2-oxoacid:acceptor oxidoreductase subunit alpha [Candidatus Eisenbacteria bacterium]
MSSTETTKEEDQKQHVLESVVIRFTGDSGDGMQLTGTQFTSTSALLGNDIATLPDFPAEIRAPAGSLPGVSGFQLHFSSSDIYTPGDRPDVLVAMNPAALKTNVADLKPNGILIVNTDSFQQRDLDKAGYASNPLEDQSLAGYQLIKVDMTRLTRKSVEGLGLDTKSADRCKNMFALGMLYWLYTRPMDSTIEQIRTKFAKKPEILEANLRSLQAGYTYCEATEVFAESYVVPPATVAPGRYRNISGNTALAIGLVAGAKQAELQLFLGSYPITPASDILHELSYLKAHGVITFQAEDEIAAIGAAIGASYAGAMGMCTTSGPGMALKTEAMGLATMVELPLVIVDIQRGGPSTGLPTKTEQADLLQAMFGRNSEAPIPVIAAATPGDCFHMAYEAVRIATRHMTPVILLSDGYLANGSEPWLLPKVEDLPKFPIRHHTDPVGFRPYNRNPETLARPWAVPGTPGLEHRIGGLEKADGSGNVSYDPLNHEHMVRTRARKVELVANDIPDQEVMGDPSGKVLVVGWGSTYGAIQGAVRHAREDGHSVSHAHIRYLNPFPKNLEDVLKRFDKILVPELNMGHLAFLLKAKYLLPVVPLDKVQGRPFTEGEIRTAIDALL